MSGTSSPAAVQATGIGRVFQAKGGPVTALDGIDLRIEPGELFGVLGQPLFRRIGEEGADFGAAGHPFAATGARIVAAAAKELKLRGGGRCLISICTAGGMGVVAILER